jgi:uncharacterized membrane protein YfcA
MWFEVLIFGSVLVAAFVQATTGFGFAIIIMSIWPLILPVSEATQLMMFGSFVSVTYIAIKYRRHINFKIVIVPLLFALGGTILGLNLLLGTDNELVIKIIGGIMMALSVYFFVFSKRVRIQENIWTASLAGTLSGILSGFFNITGPPLVLYYSAAAKDKEEYTGTVQFLFSVVVVFKMVYLYFKRGLSPLVISHIPIVVVASAIGMLLGLLVFRKLPTDTVKKIIYILMFLAGLWYIAR